jgi:hypothetical protein
MRKIAEIDICGVCLTVVDGDPGMCDGDMQAACVEAGERMAQNWPGYNVHGATGEPCHSSAECDGCGDPAAGERHPAVVLAPDYKLVNVSNPAAFGVEWSAGENGNRYQLANPRGTTGLLFGVKHEGSDKWLTTTVADPERFGMTASPTTFAQFRDVASRYVNDE